MGLKTILLIAVEVILGIVLTRFLGIYAILIGVGLAGATIALLYSRAKQKARREALLSPHKPMTLRQFIGLLQIVALVAILYSPSALSIPIPLGSSARQAKSFQDIQPYLTTLQSKYHVTIADNTTSLQQALSQHGKKTYLLIGPDTGHNLTSTERQTITNEYLNGTLSLLLSGNSTDSLLLKSLFQAHIKGDTIVDNSTSNLFRENNPYGQAFNTSITLDGKTVTGVIDDATSPIIIDTPGMVWTLATSGKDSNETSSNPNVQADQSIWPRTVVAAGETNGDRAIIISDSSPFSKDLYGQVWPKNATGTNVLFNETRFAMTLTDWVARSNTTTTLILDNAHYNLPPPSHQDSIFNLNLPIGRIFALLLILEIQFSNSFYNGFLNFARPYILGIALMTAWSMYGAITRRYATERRGKDDEPLPRIEKSIVAESKERRDFLTTSRKKGFYVATLDQMYDVLDSLVEREFGTSIATLKPEQLTNRLGEERGIQALKLFKRLGTIARYARGQKRLLLPPVMRWRKTTSQLTGEAEEILNQLGLTMTGKGQKKQLDYKLRRC